MFRQSKLALRHDMQTSNHGSATIQCDFFMICIASIVAWTAADATAFIQPRHRLDGKWLVESAQWAQPRPYMLIENDAGDIEVSAGNHPATNLVSLNGVLAWDEERKAAAGKTAVFLSNDPNQAGRIVWLEITVHDNDTLHGSHEFVVWNASGREVRRFKAKTIWRRKKD